MGGFRIFTTVYSHHHCLIPEYVHHPQNKHCAHQRPPVTESGVPLLAAQKPIKRQSWWKVKFALFWRPATGGRGRFLSEGRLPPTDNQGARAFIGRGRGYTQKQHRQL